MQVTRKILIPVSFRPRNAQKFKIFTYFRLRLPEICIFAGAFRKECKTYCSIVSQSPRRENEQTPIIGTATQTGAAFPYLGVVCGEP